MTNYSVQHFIDHWSCATAFHCVAALMQGTILVRHQQPRNSSKFLQYNWTLSNTATTLWSKINKFKKKLFFGIILIWFSSEEKVPEEEDSWIQTRLLPVRGPWHLPACGPCIPLPLPIPPLPSPSSPYLPLPSLPLEVGLLKSTYGVWGSAKLSQQGLGQSPSRNQIWCILAVKSYIWWQQF